MALCPADPDIGVARYFAAGTLKYKPPEAQVAYASARQKSLQGRGDGKARPDTSLDQAAMRLRTKSLAGHLGPCR